MSELNKPGPHLDEKILCDLTIDYPNIVEQIEKNYSSKWSEWQNFVKNIKLSVPLHEESQPEFASHCNPNEVVEAIASELMGNDIVIPCSSGGAYTTVMQGFRQKSGQLLTNNRGLASMGYGLAGALGTCFALPESRVILIEGDGGFLQNLSEIATLVSHNLNLKIFIFLNNGYASIKLSQKANFDGHYIGCDPDTGVYIPDLRSVLSAFGLPVYDITSTGSDVVETVLKKHGPVVGLVHLHPDQPFLPKIASKLSPNGVIESNPIHLMEPALPAELFDAVMKYPSLAAKTYNND